MTTVVLESLRESQECHTEYKRKEGIQALLIVVDLDSRAFQRRETLGYRRKELHSREFCGVDP